MNILARASLRLLIIVVVTFGLTACTQSSNKTSSQGSSANALAENGGGDFGGGSTLKSSPRLIIRTIELMQNLAGQDDWHNNIFKSWFFLEARSKHKDFGIDLIYLFPRVGENRPWGDSADVISPALEAIAKKKIRYIYKGDCPKPADELIADASVSAHNLSAEVCFSIGNLAALAPSDLAKQVAALFVHEAVHLGGGDEGQAYAYQVAFANYFENSYGNGLAEEFLVDVGAKIYVVAESLDRVDQFAEVDPESTYDNLGISSWKVQDIRGCDDALSMKVRLFLPNSKLPEEVQNILASLRSRLINMLDRGPSPNVLKMLPPRELQRETLRLRDDASGLYEGFEALKKEALCDDEGFFKESPRFESLRHVCKMRGD